MPLHDLDTFDLLQLASTARLAVACSYEVRRLLSLALGNVAGPFSDPTALDQMRQTLGAAGDVTRRVLTANQRSMVISTVLDLATVVEEMREVFHVLVGADAIVVAVREEANVRARVSRGHLEQILINLMPSATEAGVRRLQVTTRNVRWAGGALSFGHVLAPGTYGCIELVDDQRSASHCSVGGAGCEACRRNEVVAPAYARALATTYDGGLDQTTTDGGVVTLRVLLPAAP